MFAVRALTSSSATTLRQVPTKSIQRRSNQTVPRFGTQAEMEAEAIAQLRARVRRQKEIKDAVHHNEEEEVAEMWKWVKISAVVAVPVCVLSILKDVFLIEHAHRKHGPMPEYMEIQVKEFPWECENCALFDLECWKKCREERAGN